MTTVQDFMQTELAREQKRTWDALARQHQVRWWSPGRRTHEIGIGVQRSDTRVVWFWTERCDDVPAIHTRLLAQVSAFLNGEVRGLDR